MRCFCHWVAGLFGHVAASVYNKNDFTVNHNKEPLKMLYPHILQVNNRKELTVILTPQQRLSSGSFDGSNVKVLYVTF